MCKVDTRNELINLSLSMRLIKSSLGEFLFTLCGDFKYENSFLEKILFKRSSLMLTYVWIISFSPSEGAFFKADANSKLRLSDRGFTIKTLEVLRLAHNWVLWNNSEKLKCKNVTKPGFLGAEVYISFKIPSGVIDSKPLFPWKPPSYSLPSISLCWGSELINPIDHTRKNKILNVLIFVFKKIMYPIGFVMRNSYKIL